MKLATVTAIAAALVSETAAQSGCQFIAGNNYCNSVNLVSYNSIGFSGSYNRVTSFNSDGSCSSTPQSFSGSLAPLNEELSVHFRGPINLKQFAVYYQGGANQKRDVVEEEEDEQPQIIKLQGHHRHVHQKREAEPAFVTDFVHVTRTVYQDSDGFSTDAPAPPPPPPSSAAAPPPPPPSSAAPSSAAAPAQGNIQGDARINDASPSSVETSSAPSASPSASSAPSGSGWTQGGYYNSGGQSNGLTFMNNMGGAGSGVFDTTFGNSISYAGSDGQSCAASPQTLSDVTLPSNKEFMIFTNNQCQGDDCGYYRPGIPAYHGFNGDTKMFLFEFSMPTDTGGSSGSFNFDMPAVWFLNAQIPRTVQYGPQECSCWSSGCGEFDAFEVLNSGNTRLTSHLHSGQGANGGAYGGGGTPDWFERPTTGTLRAAVVFDGSSQTVSIAKVDGDGDFSSSYADSDVSNWITASSSAPNLNLAAVVNIAK